ncbi:Alpha-galactosidase [Hallella multisaccharivorax DSM 17128]|uniref:Alpha-galactosidase n=1 Tax=Hallella multisaccharivorax DSM 17128 TaxID=688246 RepID=F8N7G3_9BACT|nr:glycoside hydrolase family 27 protein [Hallella multisaccharivorax]EGN56390.1 Alpha-galactosidase [Hallella multisaccharivorax DSM 17128]
MKKLILLCILCVSTVFNAKAQKWENLADTPLMGWSSWNCFADKIDEEKIVGIIDAVVSSGLKDAGYVYVNIDDCWHGKRDANGFITVNEQRFPHGMKWLADYAHAKGLKLGIYSCAGYQTCAGLPGSYGHEYQDALQYARWGIDFLKEDWCNTPDLNPKAAYQLMSDALRTAGRPIYFNLCEWGRNQPWHWARDMAHSWRTTGDIGVGFAELIKHYEEGAWRPNTVMKNLELTDTLRQYAGPGHWNDPDMLEVGNGMTQSEDRAHFTMWCMLAAPLVLGNDIRTMSDATKGIVLNKDMIAIDQDKLGVQGLHFCDTQGLALWFKPLANGDWAFTILNATKNDVRFGLNWQEFNLTDSQVSKKSTNFNTTVYRVYNLWSHKFEGKTSKKNKIERTLTIPSHDVVSYRLMLNQ